MIFYLGGQFGHPPLCVVRYLKVHALSEHEHLLLLLPILLPLLLQLLILLLLLQLLLIVLLLLLLPLLLVLVLHLLRVPPPSWSCNSY